MDVKEIGGEIHRILNNTLTRPLTGEEYTTLIDLLHDVFEDAWKYQDLRD